jgi:cold shock CspA family protein
MATENNKINRAASCLFKRKIEHMSNNIIGIFVDAENVLHPAVITPIVKLAKNEGSVGALVLFGNWNSPYLAPWNTGESKHRLGSLGAVWSQLPILRPGKNASDIALTHEATLMATKGVINRVWIVSSDSDFTPLAERLEEKQIHVVVFGSKRSPCCLRNACSTFVLLDDIQNGTQTITENQPPDFCPDSHGWFHGFVNSLKGDYGFIQVKPHQSLYFCASEVDSPMTIQGLRYGDQVEFKLGRNPKGCVAVHVRKIFALSKRSI